MKKPFAPSLAILLGLATTAFAQSGTPAPDRPNVVVILADDLGWSDIGAYGSEIRTPNIDSLAGSGKKFTQFYNTARCCPSRASLLTGLYPHQAGVGHMLWPVRYPGYSTRLADDSVTLAEVLREHGYRTYMSGKWHLAERKPDPADPVGWPLQRGFDEFYGTLAGYGSFYDPATLGRGNTYITPVNDPKYTSPNFYYTDAISDNAVMFLQEHKQRYAGRPFFIYVSYTAAHWPIQVPEDSLAEYKGKYDAGYDAIRQARIQKLKQQGLMPDIITPAPTTGDWDAVRNKAYETRRMEAYAAMITRMDEGIGKIIAELDTTGQLDNTLVLYLHDNGGCDEEFFHNNQREPDNVRVMGPDELQTRTLPPMQTRDGKIVRTGEGVMAGPPESFVGYGPGWANVSDTPLRLVKKNTHEGGISTPLIAHWPAGMGDPGGELVATPGHLIDLMPTILEAAGASYPNEFNGHKIQPMEGESLIPLLTGKSTFARKTPLFWEHEGNRAVRRDQWKLVSLSNAPWELYDLSVDRGEMNDLAAERPELARELAALWQDYAERARVQPYGAHRLRSRDPDPTGTPTRLELKAGSSLPREDAPALADAGVRITARIEKVASNGVIVAHGASASGYSLFMHNGRAHFAVRRARELFTVSSEPIAPEGQAVITATLRRDGIATLQINDRDAATADFYGPLLETPAEGLSVGRDDDNPVGPYPKNFPFRGEIEQVIVETLTDP